MQRILITGATGSVGGALAKLLAQEAGVQLKVAVRDPQKLQLAKVETVAFDFEKPATYANALANIDTVFVLPPVTPAMPRTVGQFLKAIQEGEHRPAVVYLAGLHASPTGSGFAKLHGDTIQVLKQTKILHTILEPVEFMKNYLPHVLQPEQNPVIALPQGQSKKSLIAHQDIAAIAAKVIVNGMHTGARLHLAGYDYDNIEIAAVISMLTNRDVVYHPQSLAEYCHILLEYDLPSWLVDCLTELNQDIVAGKNLVANRIATQLLGRPPLTLETFAKQALADFSPGPN
jgi:NAD(P)H dehydrogenase (quinone)